MRAFCRARAAFRRMQLLAAMLEEPLTRPLIRHVHVAIVSDELLSQSSVEPSVSARLLSLALAISGCVLLLTGTAFPESRRSWGDRPWLVLDVAGPRGAVRALAFSPDSSQLYSAGLDKSVQVWSFRGEDELRATLTRSLRWQIARSYRGVIYALDVSPADGRVAVGGMCAATQNGDIVLFRPREASFDRVLPASFEKAGDARWTGHSQPISALSFSPDGRHLASASMDGEVRLWSLADGSSLVLRDPQKADAFPPVRFLTNEVVAVPTRTADGLGDWAVELVDVRRPRGRPTVLPAIHFGGVTALARDPDSSLWASADQSGQIYLWNGTGDQRPRRLRPEGVPVAMAFAPNQRLCVSVARPGQGGAALELWDARGATRLDEIALSNEASSYACAVSPDGQRLATYAPDSMEIRVCALTRGGAEPIRRPLQEPPQQRLRGIGRAVWKVAFAADGSYRVGYATQRKAGAALNDRGTISEGFDLQQPRVLRGVDLPARWRHPDDANHWRVDVEPEAMVARVSFRQRERCLVNLERFEQGPLTAYCLIPGPSGEPEAIAVGSLLGGVFIYDLPDQGPCRLLRYFRDHSDWITSVSVSKDGKYLISSSVDQTIKLWSLDGIHAQGVPFSREAAWGAVFQNQDGRVILESVRGASIAAHRDLTVGDVITSVTYALPDGRAVARGPDEILRVLAQTELWQSLELTVERDGKPLDRAMVVTPAWEPLATLFLAEGGEWAFWTPQGYYDCSVSGDQLFGWQINRGRDRLPEYFRADQFRRELERPDILRNLVSAGNLLEALRARNETIPGKLSRRMHAVAKSSVPTVRIIEPNDLQHYGVGQKIRVRAEVSYPDGRPENEFVVRAYANGVPFGSPEVDRRSGVVHYSWQVDPVDRSNRIKVVVEERARTTASLYAAAHTEVEADIAPEKFRVWLLTIAADRYASGLQLYYAVKDARGLLELVQERAGGHYDLRRVWRLEDQQVSVVGVQRAISEARTELQAADARDLLVVFLAGHGVEDNGEYFFVPPDAGLRDLSSQAVRPIGISWKVFNELRDLPCRKVFLLDTCYSGTVSEAIKKAEVRPLQRSEGIVVTATAPGEMALEDPVAEHGYFTKWLLRGLSGEADGYGEDRRSNANGNVELHEVVRFVEDRVSWDSARKQNPQCTPLELLEFARIPLIRSED